MASEPWVLLLLLSTAAAALLRGNPYGPEQPVEVGWLPSQDVDWRVANGSRLGQVAGVAVAGHRLFLFHRGPVVWDSSSFTAGHEYRYRDAVIQEPTVWEVEQKSGIPLHLWGQGMFYMPHSIHVDREGNVWTTDVALHQVFKFRERQPVMALGQAFRPGGGPERFCQPTAVAVGPRGRIFVSDGYCNHRIAVFRKDGAYLTDIGLQERMLVPHSVAYMPALNVVCVADRERRRVLCYWAGGGPGLGDLVLAFPLRHRVYAIAAAGPQTVYGVQTLTANQSSAFRLRLQPGANPELFYPTVDAFVQPHAIAVSSDAVYVADLDSPRKVYRFH